MNRLVIHLKKAHGSESYETIYSVSSEIVIRGPGPLLHGAPHAHHCLNTPLTHLFVPATFPFSITTCTSQAHHAHISHPLNPCFSHHPSSYPTRAHHLHVFIPHSYMYGTMHPWLPIIPTPVSCQLPKPFHFITFPPPMLATFISSNTL